MAIRTEYSTTRTREKGIYRATNIHREDISSIKTIHDFLPDNYWLAKKGLIANEKRLAKHPDPDMAEKYQEVFEDYKRNNMIEKVDPSDVGIPGRVHYLRHRAVIREDKETSKIRPVFDASARGSGPSLNDCLHTGPNLQSLIFDILIDFRFHKIVLLSISNRLS